MTRPDLDFELDFLARWIEGRMAGRAPRRIVVHLAGATAGDFVRRLVLAGFLVRRFPGAGVTALYRENGTWATPLVEAAPWIGAHVAAPAGAGATALLDWFDTGRAAPVRCPDPRWEDSRLHEPHLLLSAGLLARDPAFVAGLPDNPPRLAVAPADDVAEGWCAAVEQGLDNRFAEAVRARGGRVLHLATDESGPPWGDRLARLAGCRLAVGTADGLAPLACALGVPAAALARGDDGGALGVWTAADVVTSAARWPEALEGLLANRPVAVHPVEAADHLDLPPAARDRPAARLLV